MWKREEESEHCKLEILIRYPSRFSKWAVGDIRLQFRGQIRVGDINLGIPNVYMEFITM